MMEKVMFQLLVETKRAKQAKSEKGKASEIINSRFKLLKKLRE